MHRREMLWILTPQRHPSWICGFQQDIGQILTWKVFFIKSIIVYEKSDRFS